MTKKPIIIANWKMKLRWNEAVDLARGIVDGFGKLDLKNIPETVLCPSYTAMSKVRKILGLNNVDLDSADKIKIAIGHNFQQNKSKKKEGGIKLGAQDVFWEENGAYTGEISIEMLRDLKCKYFIIGHSERRQYLGETDEMVNRKLKKVLDADGIPVICVGETREERRQGRKDSAVVNQVTRAFNEIKLRRGQKAIIAYEPVWVIGTGQAMEPDGAEYMANLIRQTALDFGGKDDLVVIYGGSVDSSNIDSFIKRDAIDGFLVGSAALDVREFLRMIKLINSPNF